MKRKGFTLIEIVSAIVIIGIIAIITVPITVRVIRESKRRSFYATAEGIVKATLESNLKNEEDYGVYFLQNEYITFKFSKNEGKEGESVEEINGKKIKLSFEGKSPVGGEVHLYKNGNIEVVNLTDGTYYASKDVDTELVVTSDSSSMTRGQLQVAVEELQKQNKEMLEKIQNLIEKDETLENKNKTQDEKDRELENKINNIDVLAKTYPVGSIYISANSTNPSTIFGGTWESFGTGRTLVGVNTADSNFNTVLKTGGIASTTLAATNLPAHTHSIPALKGTAASAGSHRHSLSMWVFNGQSQDGGINRYGIGYQKTGQRESRSTYSTTAENVWGMDAAGAHTHSVTTVASTSGSIGSGTAFTNLQPYITVYMWKRTA